jgi:hypothetical protein
MVNLWWIRGETVVIGVVGFAHVWDLGWAPIWDTVWAITG